MEVLVARTKVVIFFNLFQNTKKAIQGLNGFVVGLTITGLY
jgi:hypothetical protein